MVGLVQLQYIHPRGLTASLPLEDDPASLGMVKFQGRTVKLPSF